MYELYGLWLVPFIVVLVVWVSIYAEDDEKKNTTFPVLEDIIELEDS